MNEYKYHYLYTTLDIDAFDLDDFKYNFVNITAFRLVDVDDIGVREIIKDMRRFQQKQLQKQPNQSSPEMNPKPSKFIGVRFIIFTHISSIYNLLNHMIVCLCKVEYMGLWKDICLPFDCRFSLEKNINDLTKPNTRTRLLDTLFAL